MKYHYYNMCTLQDMDLNQDINQRVSDGKGFVTGHNNSELTLRSMCARVLI